MHLFPMTGIVQCSPACFGGTLLTSSVQILRRLMDKAETLIKTTTQFRGRQPDRRPAHNQEIRRKLRISQKVRSWFKSCYAHQDYRHHQSALEQSQNSAQETVKPAESGLFHNPACDSGR